MTTDEAMAWADKRVRVVSEGNPAYDIHAAVMSDEALCELAAEVRRLRGDDLPLCVEHMEYAKSHHGECFGCDLAAARAKAARLKKVMYDVVPDCQWMYHAKKDQHGIGEPCPVVARFKAALECDR